VQPSKTAWQKEVLLDPSKKRDHPRYPFSSIAYVLDIQGNTRITGRVSDIARKGCYVDTISPLAPQTAVEVRITKENQSFTTKALVVYSQIGMGMGLIFTATETAQARILETWLSEISGEQLPEPDLPSPILQFDAAQAIDQESRSVLGELVLLLRRKQVLSDPEANALLQRLFK
jgi:PilZ domain